jgi:hypothetical protein
MIKPLLLVFLLLGIGSVHAAEVKILKVLPQHLDLQGRHALSPSLFDRDAYQAQLKKNPEQRSALRFEIQWKAPKKSGEAEIRVELRGSAPAGTDTVTLKETAQPTGMFSKWKAVKLEGDAYKKLGDLIAWRVTIWQAGQPVAEQKSFLW